MKIALAQINTTVSALEYNVAKIKHFIEKARAQGANLIIFPELTITGYPPKDLVEYPWFIEKNLKMLEEVVASSKGIGVIVGYIDVRYDNVGKDRFNAAALIDDGKIVSRHFKSLLPTYDVFDEGRYFEPAKEVKVAEFRSRRLGITICEDIWNDELYWRHRLYEFDPVEELAQQGFDLLINISASPFCLGKRQIKREMLAATARRYQRPLIQVNLVGGNDELIFDGWSTVMNASGEIVARCPEFEEALLIYDTDLSETSEKSELLLAPECAEGIEQVYRALVLGVKDYCRKTGFEKVVFGLSGGIDSAVVCALAVAALGKENCLGVAMPSRFSSEGSLKDARTLAENLGIKFEVIPIDSIYQCYLDTLVPHFAGKGFDVTEENIQARIRGNILMALSNKFGYLVLSTGNKSEISVGYCTLYGDMAGGLAVISDVPKTMVYELANYINQKKKKEIIPQSILLKPPSAELRPNQKDTDSLPPYEILDPIIQAFVVECKSLEEIVSLGFERSVVADVIRRIQQSEYKRKQAPPGLKVTSKAFGFGWRMPIATRANELDIKD